MNYTERDIEKAIRLKLDGFNWIATNKNGRPFAYGRIPYRCADDSNEYNIWDNQPGTPWLMLSKDEFTSITWENEPVYIDEIITGWKVRANGDTAIDRLIAENAELKARLERAVEPEFTKGDKAYAIMDTLFFTDVFPVEIKSVDIVYEVFDGEQITTQHCTRIFTDRAAAEARLAELGGKFIDIERR